MRVRTFIKEHPAFTGLFIVQSLFVVVLAFLLLRPAALQSIVLTPAKLADGLTLPHGAYEMTADYDPGTENPTGQTVAALDVLADGVESDTAVLTDTYTQVTARFWVTAWQGADHVRFALTPADDAAPVLKSLTLQAKPVWRVTEWLGWLLVLAAADVLLWFAARRRVPWLVILGVVLASLPYCTDFLYVGHDLNFHTYRILGVAQTLADGQFPVRLFTRAFNGYGAATPQFYCDLFLYLPALLYNCFVPLQRCFQIYVAAVNAATAAAAYYAFGRIGGERRAAQVAAFCYTLAAYRLTNVMVRAAVGEYTAMVFLPLVVLGAWALTTEERPAPRDWLPLAVGMAGLLQSHLLTAEMTAMLLVLYWLVRARTMFTPARLAAALKAAVTAVGLSAWFLVPCLDALKHEQVMVSGLHPNPLQSTGIRLVQLLGIAPNNDAGIPLTVGFAGVFTVVLALWCALRGGRADCRARRVLRTVLPFALLTMWLSTAYFPWDRLQTVLPQKICDIVYKFQFCWRWLSPTAVLLGVLAAVALPMLAQNRRLQAGAAAALVALTLVYAGSFYLNYSRTQGRYTRIGTDTAAEYPIITMGYDYLPAGTDLAVFADTRAVPADPAVTAERQGRDVFYCTNPTDADAIVDLPLLAYRHYTAQAADGTPLTLTANEAHCLRVTLPAGFGGLVTVRFAEPLLWRLAELITLATVLALAVWPVLRRLRTPQPAREAALTAP
ncbi:hypothetical protein [Gemmiger sp.]